MFAVLSDPAIYEYDNAPPLSVESLRDRYALLESSAEADDGPRCLNWIVRPRSREAIGYVQASLYDNGAATIGYELASAYWGRGYGGEAVEAMITGLTGVHRIRLLTAVVKRANARSRRLLERLAFVAPPRDVLRRFVVAPDALLLCRLAARR